MPITAAVRCSAKCVQCKTTLLFADWSESVGDGKTVHIWHCPMCGHEFETVDSVAEETLSEAELVEEFLPNLLVA